MVDLIEILKKGFCGEMSDAECANVFSCKECEIQYEEGLKEKVQNVAIIIRHIISNRVLYGGESVKGETKE